MTLIYTVHGGPEHGMPGQRMQFNDLAQATQWAMTLLGDHWICTRDQSDGPCPMTFEDHAQIDGSVSRADRIRGAMDKETVRYSGQLAQMRDRYLRLFATCAAAEHRVLMAQRSAEIDALGAEHIARVHSLQADLHDAECPDAQIESQVRGWALVAAACPQWQVALGAVDRLRPARPEPRMRWAGLEAEALESRGEEPEL